MPIMLNCGYGTDKVMLSAGRVGAMSLVAQYRQNYIFHSDVCFVKTKLSILFGLRCSVFIKKYKFYVNIVKVWRKKQKKVRCVGESFSRCSGLFMFCESQFLVEQTSEFLKYLFL